MTAEDVELRRADDAHRAVLEHRLTSLERKVDTGFSSLHETIVATSTTFVRLDLYLSERDNLRADIEAVRRLAMWSVGLVCTTAVGAVVLGIVAASGVFG